MSFYIKIMNMIFNIKPSNNDNKENLITRTIQFSLKRNKTVESPNSKKTSFLELFFDLSIVFVFTLLAKDFAIYIGVSPSVLIGDESSLIVTKSEIGLTFWIANFLLLWLIWYQYGTFFRDWGSDNYLSHLLTFFFIILIGMQGLSLAIDNDFFNVYGVLISLVGTRLILMLFEWFYIHPERRSENFKAFRTKWIFDLIKTSFAVLIAVVFIIIERKTNLIHSVIKPGIGHDDWRIQLAIVLFIFSYFVFEVFSVVWRNHNKHSFPHTKIYIHTRERHHLLLIIALGESILFNLSASSSHLIVFNTLIPDLILNLGITMLLWLIYKTFIFKPKFSDKATNLTIYVITHIFIIGGSLLMFASLKTYATAEHEYNHILKEIPVSFGASVQPNLIALIDLKHAMRVVYPLLYAIGISLYILAIMVFNLIIQYGDTTYSAALKSLRKITFMLFMACLIIIATIISLIASNIYIPLTALLGIALGVFLLRFVAASFSIDKRVLDLAGSEDAAIKEMHSLSH